MNQAVAAYEAITEQQLPLAKLLTEIHFEQNPELLTKYGKAGMEKSIQDSVYHLLYLAESVKAGNEEIFSGYLEWAASMLQSRNVPAEVLIDNLQFMAKACEALLPVEHHQLIRGYITTGIDRLKNSKPFQQTFLYESNPLLAEAKQYLSLLLAGDKKQAISVITGLVSNKQPIPLIYQHIFQATQYEVGLLWQNNKITVAHEHYCTAATQMIMSSLYPYIFEPKKKHAKMLACTIAGDYHEMGIRMVTDLFELDGWDTYYMGSAMPDVHILSALKEQRPDVFALSVTMAYHVTRAENLIRKIRADDELNKLKIIVGGYAFQVDGWWKQSGADGMATTAKEAIDTANKMIANG